MEVHPTPEATGPSTSSADAGCRQGCMALVPDVGYGLSGLGPPESASQCTEPASPHPEFAGGIMRIAPAEVNVSCLPFSCSIFITFKYFIGCLHR